MKPKEKNGRPLLETIVKIIWNTCRGISSKSKKRRNIFVLLHAAIVRNHNKSIEYPINNMNTDQAIVSCELFLLLYLQ